ncbi:pilus assembly protein CpaF [Methylacidiphilum sp. Yel]|uniref:NYN domain-containing protein n=1 Tax=Methylacidiphilum sp. Yel TaxID=1847730 RepID=UPI00106C5AC0|nr:NYN domain-containing protein [Methylacidiphilum sp. Yel]TFE68064.1 pilus assembly protein CpaF [Methylacidiphilum sp. Yel]
MANTSRNSLPLLVIDGYNVIHAWNDLKVAQRQSLRKARELLIERLSILHYLEIYQVVLVFDGKSPEPVAIPPLSDDFIVVFSPKGMSADGLIEKYVNESVARRQVTVVTSDLEEKRQVESMGAFCMSPEWLQQELAYRQEDFKMLLEKVHHNSRL